MPLSLSLTHTLCPLGVPVTEVLGSIDQGSLPESQSVCIGRDWLLPFPRAPSVPCCSPFLLNSTNVSPHKSTECFVQNVLFHFGTGSNSCRFNTFHCQCLFHNIHIATPQEMCCCSDVHCSQPLVLVWQTQPADRSFSPSFESTECINLCLSTSHSEPWYSILCIKRGETFKHFYILRE